MNFRSFFTTFLVVLITSFFCLVEKQNILDNQSLDFEIISSLVFGVICLFVCYVILHFFKEKI